MTTATAARGLLAKAYSRTWTRRNTTAMLVPKNTKMAIEGPSTERSRNTFRSIIGPVVLSSHTTNRMVAPIQAAYGAS